MSSYSRRPIRAISLLVCLALMFALAPSSFAGEPFAEFLEALRERQMYDAARLYLEQARTSPLVSAESKQRLDFEQGRLLIEEAASRRDPAERAQRLDEAEQKLNEFLKSNADPALAAEASLQLGSVLIQRAIAGLEQAAKPSQSASRQQLVADAEKRFAQAEKLCADAEAKFDAGLKAIPKDDKDRQAIERRDRLRRNLIMSRMLAARLTYESSKGFAAGSPDAKKRLTAAAEKYGQLYDKYKRYPIGLEARVRQGRALVELGDSEAGANCLEEVLAYPDDERLKPWKRQAIALLLSAWVEGTSKKGADKKLDRAIEVGDAWIEQATAAEWSTLDGVMIAWRAAQAHLARSEAGDDEKLKRADQQQALKLATDVSRHSGEFQQPAREIVAKLRKEEAATEPTTFADARSAGKAALDEATTLEQQIKEARAAGKDAEKIPAWEQERTAAFDRAAGLLALALRLKDKTTSEDDVCETQYFLAFLNYQRARYYDAAVIADFVARKYPDGSSARPAARVALFALVQAANSQPADKRETETQRLASLAEFINTRWPDQPEAGEAWSLLADVAATANDTDAAAKYLAKIPANSPTRAAADLKQGQSLWSNYLALSQKPAAQRPSQAELDKRRNDARALLEQGLARLRDGQQDGLTFNVVAAELSLAQLYNHAGEYAKALEILARPESGPLALVAAKSPVVDRPGFAAQALTAALRAYVGSQQLEKAEAIMSQLDEQYAGQPDGAALLTRIYLSLGVELEQQIARLRSTNNAAELKQLLDGSERFLGRLAKQEITSASTLNWIGESFTRLGDSRRATGDRVTAQADFDQAAKALTKLLEIATKDPALAGGVNGIRLRLARTQCGAGNFDAALAAINEIIQANPSSIEAQTEAARAYAQWGAIDPARFQQAIHGVKPATDKGAAVWGYSGIARRLQRSPKLKEQYEDARYQIADCSYRLALAKQGADKQAALTAAEKLIESNLRLDPSLGGEVWRAKYDELLKEIQRAAGRPAQGLSGLEGKSPASTARLRPVKSR